MTMKFRRIWLAVAGTTALTLSACGDGGGSVAPISTPAADTTSVPVTVIDDAIEKATVCLDKNLNGVCDAGEPSGKTDAAGKVNLQVDPADVGKFPILAVIGLDAIDAKYGPVTTAFTLTAPKDQTTVISPLTTLVQTTIANTGVSTADAAASVQSQTGISVSLFQDFTQNTTPAGDTAALIARMVVVVTQQQAAVLNSTVGSRAIDGAVVSTADLNQIIQNKLLEILPNLVTALADPAVQAALDAAKTPAQVTAALAAPAAVIVADPATGLTTASVATLVAINNQNENPVAAAPAAAPVATASLRQLTFTSAVNWFVRGFTSSVAQNTPDSANNIRYVDRRSSSTPIIGGSLVANWNNGDTPARQSDLHFTGTAWENCGLNGENVASVRDAAGNNTSNYCNNLETSKSNRATFDVSGKTMASVLSSARAAGFINMSIGDNSAAALSTALGTATFPDGSAIFYQAGTSLTNAPAYYPGIGNLVQQSNATLATGQAAACAANPQATEASNLEALVAVNAGTPCVNTANPATTGPRNEGWGATTLSLGTVSSATTGGTQPTFYTTNTPIRVAFGAANSARYYSCQQRASDGAARNCNQVGAGTYTIATLGDARVMTFSGLPLEAAPLTFQRVFVERGGKVYFGYQNKSGVSNTARLNLAGGNALLTQLGIGSVDPETPLALTATSYAGEWQFSDPAFPTESTRVLVGSNGAASCTDVSATGVVSSTLGGCTANITNPATGAFTVIFGDGRAAGNLNFLTGTVSNATFTPIGGGAAVPIVGARR